MRIWSIFSISREKIEKSLGEFSYYQVLNTPSGCLDGASQVNVCVICKTEWHWILLISTTYSIEHIVYMTIGGIFEDQDVKSSVHMIWKNKFLMKRSHPVQVWSELTKSWCFLVDLSPSVPHSGVHPHKSLILMGTSLNLLQLPVLLSLRRGTGGFKTLRAPTWRVLVRVSTFWSLLYLRCY